MKDIISKFKFPRFKRPANLKVVVLCLSTAATFWLFNALNENYDTSISYPIEWQFDREAYVVVDELPDRLQLNVQGIGWNLVRASMGLKVQALSLRLTSPATQKKIPGISLSNTVAEELEDLILNYIIDDTLRLNIDERGVRSFAVYVDSANVSLAANHKITSPVSFNVDLIELEGPLSMLERIPSDSFIVRINKAEIDNNFNEEVEFETDRPDLFQFSPEAMQVSFEVNEFVDRQLTASISKLNFPEEAAFFLNDSMANVIYKVRLDQESLVLADSFTIVADYSAFNPSDSTILLSMKQYPEQAQEVRLEHPQILVFFNE